MHRLFSIVVYNNKVPHNKRVCYQILLYSITVSIFQQTGTLALLNSFIYDPNVGYVVVNKLFMLRVDATLQYV